jgi:Flp pilus assembly pilin Flp
MLNRLRKHRLRKHRLRKLWGDTSGVAAIEFALLLPVLVALLIGCLEVTFKIWSTQKAEKLAVTLADVVAQSKAVTYSDLDKLTGAVDKIMDPFPFGADEGKIIISSVYLEPGDAEAKVNWQCSFPAGGAYTATSEIGAKGEDANLPADFEMVEKDDVIVAEVFYTYEPIAPGLMFDNDEIYRRSLFKPRLGNLITAPEGC